MNKEYNDVAIQFIKYDLGSGIYTFKPVGIIRGYYDSVLETFETDFGELYDSIKTDCECNGYFSAAYSIDDIKKIYQEEDEYVALTSFYEDFLDYVYVGISDDTQIEILALRLDTLENLLETSKLEDKNVTVQDSEISDEEYYFFSEEYIKELMTIDNLKEIRKKLSELMQTKNEDTETDKQAENSEKNTNPKHMKIEKEVSKKIKLSELKKEVLANIIGQDEAVNSVTTTIIVNENSKNPRHKSHILILGPSGTGKTEMMNIISKKLNKPVFKADATAYTKEGYVGKSVYSMLKGLIDVADGDIEKAENGILIIDEIDKKVNSKGENDVSGTAVINSLLKIMDRDIIEIDTSRDDTISFDTSNLTIVFMGAFSDLYESKEEENNKLNIGFSVEKNSKKQKMEITKTDLIEYGMPPEFLGRISKIAYTKSLSETDLINILKKSKISPLKMEQEFFEDLGIKFKYTNDYIKQLAANCLKYKTGARELKSEVQKSLEKVYEEVLENSEKIKMLKLTKETAIDNKKYYTEGV